MRYVGQNYELPIALASDSKPLTPDIIPALVDAFVAAHKQQYGFASDVDPVQFVTFRAEAVGRVEKADLARHEDAGADASGAMIGQRKVWFPEAQDFVACPIYDRALLKCGNKILGPAIIEQMDATTVMPPATSAYVEPYLNIVINTGI